MWGSDKDLPKQKQKQKLSREQKQTSKKTKVVGPLLEKRKQKNLNIISVGADGIATETT